MQVGMVVRSSVNAQGLVSGRVYEVVEVRVARYFFGAFSRVDLRPVDGGDVVPNVGNPHLVLEVLRGEDSVARGEDSVARGEDSVARDERRAGA